MANNRFHLRVKDVTRDEVRGLMTNINAVISELTLVCKKPSFRLRLPAQSFRQSKSCGPGAIGNRAAMRSAIDALDRLYAAGGINSGCQLEAAS